MFVLHADKTRLTVRAREPTTSGSVNAYTVLFEFSTDWNDMIRTAVFKAGTESRSVLLDDSGQCTIPWEVLTKHSQLLTVGVYGTRGEQEVLPTIWASLGTILEGTTTGEDAQEPTPGAYEQILGQLADIRETLDGIDGVGGIQGPQGTPGLDGKDGLSAYEIAVGNGFVGTEQDWLESLKGEPGAKGEPGEPGHPGADGKSAYQIALDNGFVGTEEEWLDSLKGEQGPPGEPASGGGIPSGCILIWSGGYEDIPSGYALCDGENGTPDLRDKFVLCAGGNHPLGETGGEEEVTLTVEQMPKHTHGIPTKMDTGNLGSITSSTKLASSVNYTTGAAGSSEPHPNMPPYYALCYIMKL